MSRRKPPRAGLPQRPRQHELETASKRAWTNILPDAWVARTITPDYGIDLEVEIFEGHGTTGLTFKVQLKSTDAKRGNPLRVTIQHETLAYWRQLDVPVLIVRHNARTGELFGIWAHSYNPVPTKREAPPASATFQLRPTNLLTRTNVTRLAHQVRRVRLYRSGRFTLPLRLGLTVQSPRRASDPRLIELRFAEKLAQHSAIITLSAGDNQGQLVISEKWLQFSIETDIASVALHDTHLATMSPEDVAADALLAVGLVLMNLRHTPAAWQILLDESVRERLQMRLPFLDYVFVTMVRDRRISEAVDLVASLVDSPGPASRKFASDAVTSLVLSPHLELAQAEWARITAYLLTRAQIEEAAGNYGDAAITHYALSQAARAQQDFALAIDESDEAMRLDPSYARRAYLHRDRGGAFYRLGETNAAIDSYGLAMQLEPDAETAFFLSDSLVRAGRYREASELPLDPAAVHPFYQPSFRVQLVALSTIRRTAPVDEQPWRRPPLESDGGKELADLDPAELQAIMIATDALDPQLWLQLVPHAVSDVDRYELTTTCAYLAHDNPAYWLGAIAAALRADRSVREVDDLYLTAIWFAASPTALFESVGALPSDFGQDVKEMLRREIYARRSLHNRAFPRELRQIGSDGAVRSVRVPVKG